MNKKVLSFLFTLIGMLVGTTSAWAETVNAKIGFPAIESDVTVSEALDYKGEVGSMAIPVSNAAFYLPTTGWLRLGDGAAKVTIPETQRATSSDVVTISFDMAWGNKQNMGSGFYLKDSEGEYIASFQMARWDAKGTNANSLNIDMTGLVGGHSGNKAVIGNATHFDITVSYAAKTITSVVTFGENSNTFTSDLTNTKSIASFEVFGYGAGANADRASIFNNLVISTRSSIKYSNDYSDEVVTWTTATSGRFTPIIQDGYLTVDQGSRNNNGTTLTSTETEGKVAAGENFTMSFDVKLGASTNQTATAFNIYDAANSAAILSFAEGATYATAWTINVTQTATVSAGGNKGIDELSWISVKVTSIAGGKTYLTLKDASGNIIDGFDKKDIPTLSETGGLGKMNFVTSRYLANFAIDNIVVREVVESEDIPATPIYTYTVKFVDQDGNEFKDASVREEYEGVVIAITEDDKATVVNGKSQYTYVSNDAAADLVAAADGSTVITVTFEKTTVADYVVNYLDGDGNVLKEATTHKNAKVGSQVNATLGEVSRMLINGVFYDQVSGNEPLTVSEDETANVINLVFAPVAGVTGYFYNNYENKAIDWKTSTGGRFDPIVVDGSTIADRATTEKKPVLDPETGETIGYEEVPGLSIPFANKTLFLAANQNTRDQNGATLTSNALNIEQADFTFEARLILGTPERDKCAFNVRNLANDADIFTITPAAANTTNTDWVINGDAENFTISLPNTGNYSKKEGDATLTNYSWYNFKVTVYNGTTFVTVTDEAGNAILDKAQVPTLATTYGISNMTFPTGRYHGNFAIDDVTVRSVVESEDVPAGAEFVAVKINYVDDAGAPLKPADEVKFQVGQPIVLNSAFTADFKVDAEGNVWTAESESAPVTKYIYVSDNSADVEVALDAQVNIVFRGVAPRRVALRPQYQTVEGEMKTKDASGKNLSFFYDSNKTGDYLFEKDILTVYYPYYLLVDGLLYKTAANSGGTDKIELEIEPGTGTQAKSPVTWTPATETVPVLDEDGNPLVDPETEQPITRDEQISNAVFAQETENIEGITPVKDTYTKIRQANGAAGSAIGGDVLVTTLEPGTYTITTATRSGTTNFKAGNNVVATITSSGTVNTVTSEEFTVDQATPLYIEEQASTTQYSDYVLVRKTKALESYKIAVAEGIVGGTIEVASSAAEGAEITITATPDEDYELSSISVTCAHKDLAVIVTDGKFTMPDDDVTVNATFRKVVYLETDLTADFISLTSPTTWKSENTSGVGQAEWAAPKVTVAGQKYFMIENYVGTQALKEVTGGVMYNEITGLTPGLYTIELYGSAAVTVRDDITATFTEGDEASLHAVTLYAEANGEKVSKYIPCLIETNFNNRGGEESIPTATLDNVVVGNDGKIKIGLYKEVGLTNWHIVQLKSVTAKISASDLLAKAVADAKNVLESQVPAKLYGDIQEAISTYDKDYETADDYQTAINALNALVDVAKAYEPLTSVLNEGAQYKANAPEEDPAIATYDQAIADVKTAYEGVAVADIPAAIAVVEAALPALAKAQTAPNSDMTRAIVNPTIDGATGWTTEKPKGGNGPLLNGTAFEYWAGSANPREEAQFDYYQVITGLPTGKYVISAEMYNSLNGEAGAEFAATSGVYGASGNDETATLVDVDGTTLTRYATEEVIVMDGTLRLGVKNTKLPMAARWFVADNFTLTLVEHIVPTYAIDVAPTEHGSLDLPAQAAAGEEVVINATADEGYELASVIVTGSVSNSVIEVTTDEWTGVQSFVMPAEAVTVSATFQEAYVKLSDYAVNVDPTFVYDPEFGDEIVATITYNSEIVGSYAESFALNAQFDYEVKDASGNVVATGTKNPLNVSDNTVTAYIDGLAENTTYTINITGVEVTDFDLATFESVVVFKDVIGLDGNPLATATFTTVKPFIAELNVERYVGQGYNATVAEVDLSAAEEYLGVNGITSDMIRIVNPDETTISDYAAYDGWFATDGTATTWSDLNATEPKSPGICVKFFQAISEGKYEICDMNGADVVDNTYTVRWAIEANDKVAFFNINVKFVEQPTVAPEIAAEVDVPVVIKSGTAYEGATAAFNVLDVTGPLNLDAISDAEQYIVNVTDGSFVANSTDSWRDANGDAAAWGTAGVGMVCVKISDPASGIIDYLGAIDDSYEDGDTYTAKWGFVNKASNTAVVLNINITFVTDPTGIDATPAADGVKPDGKYLENGKIVIYRNGNKYDASGAPMNK